MGFIITLVNALFLIPLIRNIIRQKKKTKSVSDAAWVVSVLIPVIGWIAVGLLRKFAGYYVEYLWHQGMGFEQVMMTRLWAKLGLFVGFGAIASVIAHLLLNGVISLHKKLSDDYMVQYAKHGYEEEYVQKEELKQKRHKGMWKLLRGLVGFVAFIGFGLIAGAHWDELLLMMNAEAAGVTDPIFGKDISWYMLQLPMVQSLVALIGWTVAVLLGVRVIGGVNVVLGFRNEDRDEYLVKFINSCTRLLTIPLLTYMVHIYLSRFDYLYSNAGKVFGVGATQANVSIPAVWIYLVLLVIPFVSLLVFRLQSLKPKDLKRTGIAAVVWVLLVLIVNGVAPGLYQQFSVKPTEFEKEEPYLAHSIQMTRTAYAIEDIEVQQYAPAKEVTLDELLACKETLDSVRIWDWRALSDTLNELQDIRPQFEFPDVDVDRYYVNGEYQQVTLAGRELNEDLLRSDSRTWNNLHLVYTHGYGACLNVASEVIEGQGLPNLLIKDLPPVSTIPEIQIERPEIYYGLLTDTYKYVGSGMKEYSCPDVYSSYEGQGGVELGSGFRRVALALKFDGLKVLISKYLTPETRVMWRQHVRDRIKEVMPFMVQDRDAYLVIGDQRLFYVVDLYTTSSRYPYAMPFGKMGGDKVNYVRNSVKAVVDCYNGSVDFYVFDKECPILNAWRKIYPSAFKEKGEMPEYLVSHVRYPEDMLALQGAAFADFHMTDVFDFYQKNDRFDVAKELYMDDLQKVEPYSIIAKLPGEETAEYMLMIPFTPEGKSMATAWMAGRSDGENYGKLIAYEFPKNSMFYGPEQIEGRIDKDKHMSGQLTLWKDGGSDIIRGNMLMIPVAGTILYAEPIYIYSEASSMPELAKVVVGVNNKIAWGDSFYDALYNVFDEDASIPARSVENGLVPLAQEFQDSASTSSDVGAAVMHLDAYRKLTAEGKYSEAGKHLEALEILLKQPAK